jgi:hypothetical protein
MLVSALPGGDFASLPNTQSEATKELIEMRGLPDKRYEAAGVGGVGSV